MLETWYNDLKEYIFNLNETLDPHKSSAESCIIVFLSILYANYILEEPVHPEGAEFPESQKVLKKESYCCPAKEGNLENPNTFCRLCIAEQLDLKKMIKGWINMVNNHTIRIEDLFRGLNFLVFG